MLDEALQLARRSLALQSRAGEGSTNPDRLLLARVLAARGDVAELAELLPALTGDDVSADDRAYRIENGIARQTSEIEPRWRKALTRKRARPEIA